LIRMYRETKKKTTTERMREKMTWARPSSNPAEWVQPMEGRNQTGGNEEVTALEGKKEEKVEIAISVIS